MATHTHVRSDNADICAQCGRDLRDAVHTRATFHKAFNPSPCGRLAHKPTIQSESLPTLIRETGREIEAFKALIASAARQLESGVDPLQVAQQLRGGLRGG